MAETTRRDPTVLEEVSIRLQRRKRFEGDLDASFWQADVWPDGNDYHAVGATPHEALLELALFWRSRSHRHPTPPAAAKE